MRTFLTILGIIIGVMAVISLVTVMESATGEVTSQFESLGANKLVVQTPGTALKRGLTEKDLKGLSEIPGVKGYTPTLSRRVSVIGFGELLEDVTVDGYSENYFRQGADTVERGRPIVPSDIEYRNNVCVIDGDLAKNLLPGVDPLGQIITVQGIRYLVVGLLAEKEVGDVMSMTQTGTVNGRMIIPYTSYMKLFGMDLVNSLEIYTSEDIESETIRTSVENTFDRYFNYKDDSYTILNMESLLDVMDTMLGLMTNLLVGIASISLLVGGIGIMNMMLVSVTERTNEIGLRKALGARPRSIQMQFLMESIMLSLFGGIIGLILGLTLSYVISNMMDIVFVFSSGAIILGFGFSLLVGVIFGWAPARKASNLNPIDALRSM